MLLRGDAARGAVRVLQSKGADDSLRNADGDVQEGVRGLSMDDAFVPAIGAGDGFCAPVDGGTPVVGHRVRASRRARADSAFGQRPRAYARVRAGRRRMASAGPRRRGCLGRCGCRRASKSRAAGLARTTTSGRELRAAITAIWRRGARQRWSARGFGLDRLTAAGLCLRADPPSAGRLVRCATPARPRRAPPMRPWDRARAARRRGHGRCRRRSASTGASTACRTRTASRSARSAGSRSGRGPPRRARARTRACTRGTAAALRRPSGASSRCRVFREMRERIEQGARRRGARRARRSLACSARTRDVAARARLRRRGRSRASCSPARPPRRVGRQRGAAALGLALAAGGDAQKSWAKSRGASLVDGGLYTAAAPPRTTPARRCCGRVDRGAGVVALATGGARPCARSRRCSARGRALGNSARARHGRPGPEKRQREEYGGTARYDAWLARSWAGPTLAMAPAADVAAA